MASSICRRCGRSGPTRPSLAGPRFPVCRDVDCSTAGKSDLEITLGLVADLPFPSGFDAPEEYTTAYDTLAAAYILATEGL